MTLLAERTQQHIVFPTETLALILPGFCGAAGGCGGGSRLPMAAPGQVWQELGAWKTPGLLGSGQGTWECGPLQLLVGCGAGQGPPVVAWAGTKKGLDFGRPQ